MSAIVAANGVPFGLCAQQVPVSSGSARSVQLLIGQRCYWVGWSGAYITQDIEDMAPRVREEHDVNLIGDGKFFAFTPNDFGGWYCHKLTVRVDSSGTYWTDVPLTGLPNPEELSPEDVYNALHYWGLDWQELA